MKQFFTFSLLLLTIGLFAQPANDDCGGIIDLGVAPNCDSIIYNNFEATESNIGTDNFPSCFVGIPDRDVWFQFTATTDFLDYRIEVTGCEDVAEGIAAMSNPQIAIYRGDCEVDGLQELDCVTAAQGEGSVFMDLIGLTPGITYFLRINDWSSTATPNEGGFKLCVREKPPIITIDQGSSNECTGTLTDSGGEFGDYGNNENFTFTICPTAPHECILFNMQYYNIEFETEQISFFDGPDTLSPQIGNINGTSFISPTPTYGGVCYSVSASSGCMTIQFNSDDSNTFEGFLGTWECTSEECPEIPELEVDADASPDDIIESVISGQTLISLVDVDCSPGQVGTFTITDETDLGMGKGLVLSSGTVENIANPASFQEDGFYGGENQTDPDLEYLSSLFNGATTQDACVVSLDVLAAAEELTFEYVFGSEEYIDYITGEFNDIFALLVSGPGITGDPNMNDQENVSTLPDGTFIQINSVNHLNNWQYFRDNSNSQTIKYGGLTSDTLGVKKSLTARVETTPCETYKLKFAIADRGDNSFDSGVFISKINSGTPELNIDYQSGIDYLVESCTTVPDQLVISFGTPIETTQTYQIVIGGNAERDADYEINIPPTVVFETGTEIFTYDLTILPDTIAEGIDTIEISLVRDFGCGELVVSSITLQILDNLQVEILDDIQDTTVLCASAGCIPLEVTGAQNFMWSPDSLFNDPTSPNPTVCTQTSQWVYVEGTLGNCTDIDSTYIEVIDVEINIVPDEANVILCAGENYTVFAENNVNDQNLEWTSFFNDFTDPSNPEQEIVYQPGISFETATVSVEVGGCLATDIINIDWVPLEVPQLIDDITICQNSSVQLAEEIISTSTTYEWSPDIYLSPSTDVSGPITTPEETTTYTLISTAGAGDNICSDTSSVTITVLSADIEIQPADTAFICVGDTAILTNINSNNGDVTWSPQDFMNIIGPEEVRVSPPLSQWYFATLETVDCIVKDSVWVQVDSLPDLSIMADPDKDSYCVGEEVLLFSETYEPANFPAISPMWESGLPGVQTPDSFLNLVFIAVEDFTYIRTTTVNACESVDSIEIIVTPVVNISVIPTDTTVCQGEQVQFTIDGPPELTDFMWMPADGLSCTDCREPIATVSGSVSYQVEAEFEGCPVGASATINVPDQFFQYSGPNPICPGTSITLNSLNVSGATYSWTSSDGSLTTNDPQPNVSPSQTTTYNLVATLGNCSLEASLTIEVYTNFEVTVDPTSIICPGGPVTLTATSTPSSTGISYVWTNTLTGEEISGNPATVNPTITADWQLVASDMCFVNVVDFEVEVAPDFTVTANPISVDIVQGQSATFSADASVPGIDFSWLLGTSEVGTGNNFSDTPCDTTTYTLVGTDFNGCTNTTFVQAFVEQLDVVVSPDPGITIAGEDITFTASANVGNVDYTWKNSSGEEIGNGSTLTVSSCSDQTYSLAGVVGDCPPDEKDFNLIVQEGFSVNHLIILNEAGDTIVKFDTIQSKYVQDTTVVYEGEQIQIIGSTDPDLSGATFYWKVNEDTIAVTNQPSSGLFYLPEIFSPTEDLLLELIVVSQDGCDDNGMTSVEIANNPVEAPNVFTPNGDNTNDNFTLVSLKPVDILEFRIWNRWGKKVYDNENGLDGWDGMIDGKAAASDVYIYSIVYQIPGSNNPMKPLRGDVTLLR